MFDKMLQCPPRPLAMDRRWKASVELAPNCPRCASSDTKFCYYNNYSLSQPRYFCKACRRYWTKGGSLRNVPVGGGGRKNSRAKSAKLTPSERISMISHCRSQTTSDLPRDNPLGNSCSSDGNKTFPPTTGGVSSIDHADVFAKFLNQNSCFDPLPDEVDSSFNLMNSFNPNDDLAAVQFPEENNMIECQRTSELAPDNLLIGGSPHVFSGEFGLNNKHDQERIPELTPEDYGLQQFVGVGDEIVEAAPWSDSQAVPNFTLQQLQRQEQVPSADDHFTIYSNLLNDNWSSFDLPSYGVFPRP